METLSKPQLLTLSDLDREADFAPLESMVSLARPARCEYIEFHDDNYKPGYRQLEFNASVQYGICAGTGYRGEVEPKYEVVRIGVAVHPEMDIEMMVRAVISEVQAEIDNLIDN